MANATRCLTPGAVFSTIIDGRTIGVSAKLPFELELTEEEAEVLEALMHNQMETLLWPYFERMKDEERDALVESRGHSCLPV